MKALGKVSFIKHVRTEGEGQCRHSKGPFTNDVSSREWREGYLNCDAVREVA